MKKILTLCMLLALISLSMKAQPVAAFSADVTEGCSPLIVEFTDASTSTEDIITWDWDFGDGMFSNDQHPSHEYATTGTYDICLTVTDTISQMDTHCEPVIITAFENPIADAGIDMTLTCVNTSVTLDATGSSTGSGITYEWRNSNGDLIYDGITVEVSLADVYTFIVTNENGCTASDVVEVVADQDPPIADAGIDYLLTCIEPMIELNAAGSSTGPEIVYDWMDQNGIYIGNEITVLINSPGQYILLVTNTNTGCTASDVVIVFDDIDIPLAEITVNPFCNFPATLGIGNSSSGPNFSYEWLDETGIVIGTDIEIQISNQGAYTLVVTNTNSGCTSSTNHLAFEPSTPLTVSVNLLDSVSCASNCDGALIANASGGCGDYYYEWSNGDIGSVMDYLCEGVYSVTVIDCNGCTVEGIGFLPDSSSDISLSSEVTCATASNDGAIDLTVSGGVPPYTYLWSNLSTSEDINNLTPGFYTVQVMDQSECTVSTLIEVGSTIVGILGGNATYCDASQVPLEVIAPDAVSYEWSAGNLSCYDCPNPIATVGLGEETSYSVTVTEANGCMDIGFINFNVQSYLDFNLLQFTNSPVYPGQEILFDCNVINPISVNWTGPGSFTSTECNPVISDADIGNAGNYSLDIVDEYGCTAIAVAEVVLYDIIEFISNDTIICDGGEVVLLEVIASNAVNVEWVPATGLDNPFSFTPLADPAETTTYTVTVTDGQGNSESASVTIVIDPPVQLLLPGDLETCEGASVYICANTGLSGTFVWTGPNGFLSLGKCFSFSVFSSNMAGCYTLLYTSPNGCETMGEVCITVFEFPAINIIDLEPICPGESITLDLGLSTGFDFQWVPSTGLSCTDCSAPIASPAVTTIYAVIISDLSSGCETLSSFQVVVDQTCVWPGDTDTSKVVDNFDLLNIGLAYDSTGSVRPNASLNWVPQAMDDWLQTTPSGVNYKHIDCDGNGIINADDTLAITQNWGEVHAFKGEDEVQFFMPNYPQSSTLLTAPFYVEPDTFIENESYALPIILGEMGNEAEDVYGLAFSLEYDSTVVVPGSASIGFNGWIGNLNDDMIAIQKTFVSPGRIDVGLTRIDGTAMTGFGQMGLLYITIEDDVLFRGEDENRDADELEIVFNITNVLIINNLGEDIPVVPMETSGTLEETVSAKEINWSEHIQILPNPANEAFFVTTKNIKIEQLQLFSITGELLLGLIPETSATKINTSGLTPGMYLMKVQTELGVLVERVLVLR